MAWPAAAFWQRRSVRILLLAVAYCVAGLLTQWLALPPADVAPVWPPAGIALAALYLAGCRLWPGVWLGAVAEHLINTGDVGVIRLWVAAGLGAGAVLQAALGAWLVGRVVTTAPLLYRPAAIVRVLLVAAPVSCLVGASVGVVCLLAAGYLSPAAAPAVWLTWWFGDAVGVFIVMPLALAWMAQGHPSQWLGTVALPIVLALAVVSALFFAVHTWENERLRLGFEQHAATLAESTARQLENHLEVLYFLRSYFAGSQAVNRDEFRAFVSRALARRPGFQALTWHARVTDGQRAAFEAAVRREGFPAFRIVEGRDGDLVPAGRRDEYFPTLYVEPFAANRQVLGLDAAASPDHRDVLARARQTGEPAATGRVSLVQDTGDQYGWLVFAPVYKDDESGPGEPALLGYVTGVFRLGDLIRTSLEGLDR
nr:CHASE domain-containing protein [Pseudomonadota bacterium]